MLETDAPYLAPVPHRGKRNESAYVPLIAEVLAEVKGVSVEEVAKATTETRAGCFIYPERKPPMELKRWSAWRYG